MLRYVADHERVRADPHTSDVAVHDDIVPRVVVRSVDEYCPAPGGEGTGREIAPPGCERTHVLAHIALDVAWHGDRLRGEPAEVELVQKDVIRRGHLLLPECAIRSQAGRAAISLRQRSFRRSQGVDGLHICVVVGGKLCLCEKARQLRMGQRGYSPRLKAGLAHE